MVDFYWKKRSKLKYYRKIKKLTNRLIEQGKVNSILEVGGRDGYFLSKFPEVSERVVVDISKQALSEKYPKVTKIREDFLTWKPPQKFDLVLCCQVLEHIPNSIVKKFTRKLFQVGKRVIISVPYQWPEGFCKDHVQDPVDEEKLKSWTQRKPNKTMIAKDKRLRIITYYRPD